jgi:hypothetical protein
MRVVILYLTIGLVCAYFSIRDFPCGNFDKQMCRNFAISDGMLTSIIWPYWLIAKMAAK